MKCEGCGALLQTNDQNSDGYTSNLEHKYCVACYKLLHYGKDSFVDKPEIEELNIDENDLVLLVCGLFYLDNVFNLGINYPNMVLIVNQIDLLPEQTNLDNFKANLIKRAKNNKYQFSSIFFMSAVEKSHIDELRTIIEKSDFKNIYLLGQVNSGKTTIFNGLTKSNALSNLKRGLTRGVIVKSIGDKNYFDTVGYDRAGYLDSILGYEEYKRLIPTKQIRPKVFQVNREKGYDLNGICSIVTDKQFVLYGSEEVKITNLNLESINLRYENSKYKKYTFSKNDSKLYQLTILDFVLIHINSPFNLIVYSINNSHISIKEALFK